MLGGFSGWSITAAGRIARTWDEALEIVEFTGYPAIIRPSFTLGGSGGGISSHWIASGVGLVL